MLFRNVTIGQLYSAADRANVRLIDPRPEGRGYRATLGLITEGYPPEAIPFQRRSPSAFRPTRKVNAVCWHGHGLFFAALFEENPDAIVIGGRENGGRHDGARASLPPQRPPRGG